MRPLDVLVLYEQAQVAPRRAAHVAMFGVMRHGSAHHRTVCWNCAYGVPRLVRAQRFDLVILDSTFMEIRNRPEFAARRHRFDWLASAPAVKVAMPQDEYLRPDLLDGFVEQLQVDLVFSACRAEQRPLLYPRSAARVEFHRSFPGYVDERLLHAAGGTAPRPHGERPLDLAYRARRPPYYLGRRAQLKHEIAAAGAAAAARAGLRADIATGDDSAILGPAWFGFLASARAVLGVESGAGAIDWDGSLRASETALRAADPALTFDEYAAAQRPGWDADGIFTIGPRHLEAAATRTCQVLVEGAYDGVLEPERHYIPVSAELDNIDDAVARLGDVRRSEEMAERAYDDLVRSGTYSQAALARQIERAVAPRVGDRPRRAAAALAVSSTALAATGYDAAAIRAPRLAYRLLAARAPRVLGAATTARRTLRRAGVLRSWP